MRLPAVLSQVLETPDTLVIALSGGIDSLTLSAAAKLARKGQALRLCHAVSPAVPKAATERVRNFADVHGMPLDVVDAGEFSDPAYRANPVNRCYFCKSHLYRKLAQMGKVVAAGTNLDDLGDFRPGLMAAEENSVLHPFVTAMMTKHDVRKLATGLGLGALADLPASPCLASRVETGLKVEPEELLMIDAVETRLREELGGITLRCRRTHDGFAIEIDPAVLTTLGSSKLQDLQGIVRQKVDALGGANLPLSLRPYRRGSAFLHG